MDIWHKTLNFLDHHRYLCAALALVFFCCAGLLYGGCSRTLSLMPGNEEVSRDKFIREAEMISSNLSKQRLELETDMTKFNTEVELHNALIQAGLTDLNHQDQVRADIINTVSIIATETAAGSFNPAALIPLVIGVAGSMVGIGTSLDKFRTDKLLKTAKNELKANGIRAKSNPAGKS